ncbi:MAG: ATPase, T2SS/T4P/T4SS family, partial [Gemmataceae bacterium]
MLEWYPGLRLFAEFPRGPGFYFNPLKFLAVGAVYLIWVRTCWWVDQDCREVDLPTAQWNPMILAGGFIGLILLLVVPKFLVSFPTFLLLFLAPTLVYVGMRNNLVSDSEKVLTPRHLRKVALRLLGLKGKSDGDNNKKAIPVRFIGKSSKAGEEDSTRVRRAAESQHYRSSLELVYDAIQSRATDIHLEPTKEEMTVRFRVDGILQPGEAFSRDEGDAVLNIFKVLADMDITEKRKPQDGSFSAEAMATAEGGVTQTRLIDFRVATSGSVVGEKMVMRLLDRSKAINDLGQLGMRDKLRDQIRGIVTQP